LGGAKVVQRGQLRKLSEVHTMQYFWKECFVKLSPTRPRKF